MQKMAEVANDFPQNIDRLDVKHHMDIDMEMMVGGGTDEMDLLMVDDEDFDDTAVEDDADAIGPFSVLGPMVNMTQFGCSDAAVLDSHHKTEFDPDRFMDNSDDDEAVIYCSLYGSHEIPFNSTSNSNSNSNLTSNPNTNLNLNSELNSNTNFDSNQNLYINNLTNCSTCITPFQNDSYKSNSSIPFFTDQSFSNLSSNSNTSPKDSISVSQSINTKQYDLHDNIISDNSNITSNLSSLPEEKSFFSLQKSITNTINEELFPYESTSTTQNQSISSSIVVNNGIHPSSLELTSSSSHKPISQDHITNQLDFRSHLDPHTSYSQSNDLYVKGEHSSSVVSSTAATPNSMVPLPFRSPSPFRVTSEFYSPSVAKRNSLNNDFQNLLDLPSIGNVSPHHLRSCSSPISDIDAEALIQSSAGCNSHHRHSFSNPSSFQNSFSSFSAAFPSIPFQYNHDSPSMFSTTLGSQSDNRQFSLNAENILHEQRNSTSPGNLLQNPALSPHDSFSNCKESQISEPFFRPSTFESSLINLQDNQSSVCQYENKSMITKQDSTANVSNVEAINSTPEVLTNTLDFIDSKDNLSQNTDHYNEKQNQPRYKKNRRVKGNSKSTAKGKNEIKMLYEQNGYALASSERADNRIGVFDSSVSQNTTQVIKVKKELIEDDFVMKEFERTCVRGEIPMIKIDESHLDNGNIMKDIESLPSLLPTSFSPPVTKSYESSSQIDKASQARQRFMGSDRDSNFSSMNGLNHENSNMPTTKIQTKETTHNNKNGMSNINSPSAHFCTWNNPTTGLPCFKHFSRPYDLIRHQETIHAKNRKTFKCEICGDASKTFSRQDAVSRHMRVKHNI